MRSTAAIRRLATLAAALALTPSPLAAQEQAYGGWDILRNPFASTGGGGS